MNVFLPSHFTLQTMYGFIGKVLDRDSLPRYERVIFDFTKLKFIEPVGITVLSNLIGRLDKYNCSVAFKFNSPDRNNKSCPIAFLDDAMFFKYYLNETLDNIAELRQTTFPLKNVKYSESIQYLNKAIYWLAGKLNMSKSSLGDIENSLKEIFNNIDNHSSEQIASTFIQHFPNKKEVKLSISDFGIGIPTNVQKIKPFLSDGQAILQAIQQGFSTKTVPGNRGAGLDLLLHNVVINNKGYVYIHSNHGILRCTYNGFGGMSISESNVDGFYPGTLLDIGFKTDTIENLEEEFTWE